MQSKVIDHTSGPLAVLHVACGRDAKVDLYSPVRNSDGSYRVRLSAMRVRSSDFLPFVAEPRAKQEERRFGPLSVVSLDGVVEVYANYSPVTPVSDWIPTSLAVRHLRPDTLAYQLYS